MPNDDDATAMDRTRGRLATKPWQVPPRGWWETLRRVWDESSSDNLSLVSAGVAFYFLFAMFPTLTALVSTYGLIADPSEAQQIVLELAKLVPRTAMGVLEDQLTRVASQENDGLTIGVVVGLVLSIGFSSRGVVALMGGLNIAYEEREARGFIKLNASALGLLAIGLVPSILGIGLVALLPVVLLVVGLQADREMLLNLVRWPVLALSFLTYVSLLYRFGPSRTPPQWSWLSPGAVVAAALWLVASGLFGIYLKNFSSYNETYGSLAGVMALLMWLWLTALSILLGAELNAELERQTRKDTTRRPLEPMGQRGAFVADHLPDSSEVSPYDEPGTT